MDRVIGWFRGDSSKVLEKQDTLPSPAVLQDKDRDKTNEEKHSHSDLNNNEHIEQVNTVKPVLYSETTAKTKMLLWIRDNTYLQPEDCLFCKLTISTCATLAMISGFTAYNHIATRKKIDVGRRRASQTIIFAMWAIFMYKEWYNAVFLPPGDKPRSFMEAERLQLAQWNDLWNKRTDADDGGTS